MDDASLFASDAFEPAPEAASTPPGGEPRVRYAVRNQREWVLTDLESLVPEDHPVRIVWAFVECQDLAPLYALIRSCGSSAGAPSTDPKILLALWLYTTLEGNGSARRLDELCREHNAYRWLCGGVSMNYHSLSDFRTAHEAWLDAALTHQVAALMAEGLVEMHRVAQDGMRVRASAGAASYHRRPTLERCLAEAQAQVEALKAERDTDPAAGSRRSQAARERAARERRERLEQALQTLEGLEAQRAAHEARKASAPVAPEAAEAAPDTPPASDGPEKKKKEKKEKALRVSATDPAIPVMKMPDGGFRPAVNVEFATDTASQIITGVDAIPVGTDQGQALPMMRQHEARYGRGPQELLIDGGFAKKEDIEALAGTAHGCAVYAPVPEPKKAGRDPYQPLPGDGPGVGAWRARMGTPEAQAIYKERASTAECVNALARARGLRQFTVRGLRKIRAVVLWVVLAHNLLRAHALRQARTAAAA